MPQIESRDKIICSVLYLTKFFPATGLSFLYFFAPLLYLMFLHFTKRHISSFTRYHCYQVILLQMLLVLVPQILTGLLNLLTNILSIIPLLEALTSLLNSLVGLVLVAFYFLGLALCIYGAIWTLRGRFTRMPLISEAIEQILRQY